MKDRMDEQRAGSAGGAAKRADGRERTSAVVVTYEPGPELVDNLTMLWPQVDTLIVVDNGSSPPRREVLGAAVSTLGLELIENGSNLGIATALNYGVQRAMEL